MSVQLAVGPVSRPSAVAMRPPTWMMRAFGAHQRHLVGQRPHDVDLQLGRRVGLARPAASSAPRSRRAESSSVANQPPCTRAERVVVARAAGGPGTPRGRARPRSAGSRASRVIGGVRQLAGEHRLRTTAARSGRRPARGARRRSGWPRARSGSSALATAASIGSASVRWSSCSSAVSWTVADATIVATIIDGQCARHRSRQSTPRGCTNLKLRQLTRRGQPALRRFVGAAGLKTTQYSLLSHVDAARADRGRATWPRAWRWTRRR